MYPSLHWISDLSVSLCYLLGQVCSSLLITRPHPISKEGKPRPVEEQQKDELLVNSDLWKTLFRGGYMIGKLTRSLSGAYVRKYDFCLCVYVAGIMFGPLIKVTGQSLTDNAIAKI